MLEEHTHTRSAAHSPFLLCPVSHISKTNQPNPVLASAILSPSRTIVSLNSTDASVITCKLPTGIYYLLFLGSFQRKRHLIICVCVYIYMYVCVQDIFHLKISEHFTEYE